MCICEINMAFLEREEHIMKSDQLEQGVTTPKVWKPLALAG